jgi:hypothetical protein
MIAPASPADWLRGSTITALLAGVAITFWWMLGLDEQPLEEPVLEIGDLHAPRGSVLVGTLDA